MSGRMKLMMTMTGRSASLATTLSANSAICSMRPATDEAAEPFEQGDDFEIDDYDAHIHFLFDC